MALSVPAPLVFCTVVSLKEPNQLSRSDNIVCRPYSLYMYLNLDWRGIWQYETIDNGVGDY